MTETEPEFDPIERDSWAALSEYEDALCPQCKRLRSICENDDQLWYPQRHVCHATAAQQNASRKFHTLYRDSKPDAAGYLPTDGHLIWASDQDLSPDDDFLGESLPQPDLADVDPN